MDAIEIIEIWGVSANRLFDGYLLNRNLELSIFSKGYFVILAQNRGNFIRFLSQKGIKIGFGNPFQMLKMHSETLDFPRKVKKVPKKFCVTEKLAYLCSGFTNINTHTPPL